MVPAALDQIIVYLRIGRKGVAPNPVFADDPLDRAPSEKGPVVIAVIRDITCQAEEPAQLIRDRTVAVERAKGTMPTVISHQMRTPLTDFRAR